MKRTHTLKCWDVYFDAVKSGEKTFEVRRDDRGFQRGDVVVLQRCKKQIIGGWEVQRDFSTGIIKAEHEMRFSIGWILTGGQLGIEPGFVVFSLKRLDKEGV